MINFRLYENILIYLGIYTLKFGAFDNFCENLNLPIIHCLVFTMIALKKWRALDDFCFLPTYISITLLVHGQYSFYY